MVAEAIGSGARFDDAETDASLFEMLCWLVGVRSSGRMFLKIVAY